MTSDSMSASQMIIGVKSLPGRRVAGDAVEGGATRAPDPARRRTRERMAKPSRDADPLVALGAGGARLLREGHQATIVTKAAIATRDPRKPLTHLGSSKPSSAISSVCRNASGERPPWLPRIGTVDHPVVRALPMYTIVNSQNTSV